MEDIFDRARKFLFYLYDKLEEPISNVEINKICEPEISLIHPICKNSKPQKVPQNKEWIKPSESKFLSYISSRLFVYESVQ